jgi:hypothetical protein
LRGPSRPGLRLHRPSARVIQSIPIDGGNALSLINIHSFTATSNPTRSIPRGLMLLFVLALLVPAFVTVSAAAHPSAAIAMPPVDDDGGDGGGNGGGGGSGGPAAASAVEIQFWWWGANISLDRTTACFAAKGIPQAGDLLLLTIPPPWGPLALVAVKAHKAWIHAQMGTAGVDLHFNWAGFLHWVGPRGHSAPNSC